MWATLRQRDFSLLWFAGLISLTGNWMLSIALPVMIYQMTGSALAIGGMLLANTLPRILFSSMAGVFVDRWERRRTMVVINLLLALSILPLLLVRSAEWLWLVYAVSFVQSTLAQFFGPAENAMLPLLAKPEQLVSANALNALNNNLARLIGPALGGLIAPLLGVSGVVTIDALTYLVAALLAALISVTSHPGKETAANGFSPRMMLDDWLDGLRLVWREKTVRTLFALSTLPAIGESAMYVLFVPFVTEVLHGDSLHVGGFMSAQALGGLLGGAMIGWIAAQVKPARLLAFGAIGIGLADLVLFNYWHFSTSLTIGYMMFLLAGPFAVGFGAGFNTLLQNHVADAYRGRVFGTFNLTGSLFTLIGIAIAGAAADTIGIVPVINIQAYVYLLMGMGYLLLLRERTPMQRSPEMSIAET